MTDFRQINIPTFNAPGIRLNNIASQMIEMGGQLRDEIVWQYPLLPGALFIFQEMASQREFKVSGKPRAVARSVEYLNNSVTHVEDGTIDIGFEQLQKRRAMDYNCIGRTIMHWGPGKPLEYLDPYFMYYDSYKKKWVNRLTQQEYDPKYMIVNHPIPLGSSGNFVSPVSFVVPTAMLAWLVQQHDTAAADGRKIRDVMVVGSEELASSIKQAVEEMIEVWSGRNPASGNGIPVAWVDARGNSTGQPVKVADMIARLGVANIPENFDREQFTFLYVNMISSSLGLALRHFWNSEKATNRALEEVQEARQNWKGPAAYVRTEQRLIEYSGCLKQFDPDTRMSFVEEIDMASQEVNSKVLLNYANAAKVFAETGIVLDGKDLVAWLQKDDILPADMDILSNITITNPESVPTPNKKTGTTSANSDSMTAPISKSVEDELSYDEITMDGKGRIIERRPKVFSFEKSIRTDLSVMADGLRKDYEDSRLSWSAIVEKAKTENVGKFKSAIADPMTILKGSDELLDISKKDNSEITTEDHRKIRNFLDAISA